MLRRQNKYVLMTQKYNKNIFTKFIFTKFVRLSRWKIFI